MLDLNHILLFIACLSPLVVLARASRHGARKRSWQLAALTVLLITALAFLIAPQKAGFAGGGAWLLLLFLPAVGSRKAAELASVERYGAARRLLGFLRFLHPTAAVGAEHSVLRGLEMARAGDRERALQILQAMGRTETRAADHAIAQSFRIRGDWNGLLTWCRGNIPRVGLGEDPSLLLLYFRALGELGLRDELALQFAGRAPALLASPVHKSIFASGLPLLLAFCGRTAAIERLLWTRLGGLRSDAKEFWIATSEFKAGNPAGRARLEDLRTKTTDALLRADIAERLEGGASEPPLIPANEATVRRFERNLAERRSSLFAPRAGITPAVLAIIALNAAMFLLEIRFGGSQDAIALHRLGALEPAAVLALGQYWRLLAALFLHYGALHLMMNAYALYVLGPSLEASIGTVRFLLCYLLAGIGSSAGVVALWRLGLTQADLLVGASGAVMGVVGAWAGLLLGHRHVPMARRRLINIAIIVAIQSAFDLSTPQVSMAAHLSGFASGLLVGLVIAPGRPIRA